MHTVIVGGGFGGIKAALELSKAEIGRVTLISERPYFVHHGVLRHTLTGGDPHATAVPLDDIFATRPNVRVVQAKLTSLNPDRNLVVCGHDVYDYSQLILALGSESISPSSTDDAHGVFGSWNLAQIAQLHEHLFATLTSNQPVDRRYVVVGGGTAGVELAGLLAEYAQHLADRHLVTRAKVRIMLVEAADRILPALSHQASRTTSAALRRLGVEVITRTRVAESSTEYITIGTHKLTPDTLVWATGTRNNPFFAEHTQLFDVQNDSVVVNPYLEAYRDIFVIGDHTTMSSRMHSALDMADYVAQHIVHRATGALQTPYRPATDITTVPVGTRWAYAECLGVYVTGALAMSLHTRLLRASYRRIMPRTLADAAVASYTTKNNNF